MMQPGYPLHPQPHAQGAFANLGVRGLIWDLEGDQHGEMDQDQRQQRDEQGRVYPPTHLHGVPNQGYHPSDN